MADDESTPESAQRSLPESALAAQGEADDVRLFRSDDLFAGRRVVLIEHGGQQYRLLITRNDRLILQK